jgi:hypothetical protein
LSGSVEIVAAAPEGLCAMGNLGVEGILADMNCFLRRFSSALLVWRKVRSSMISIWGLGGAVEVGSSSSEPEKPEKASESSSSVPDCESEAFSSSSSSSSSSSLLSSTAGFFSRAGFSDSKGLNFFSNARWKRARAVALSSESSEAASWVLETSCLLFLFPSARAIFSYMNILESCGAKEVEVVV